MFFQPIDNMKIIDFVKRLTAAFLSAGLLFFSLLIPQALHANINTKTAAIAKKMRLQDWEGALSAGLNPNALKVALLAYNKALKQGYAKKHILTIVDFSEASVEKRLWVLDVDNHTVLFNGLVAHGQGSGLDRAVQFSNQSQSHASSLGLYGTEDVYYGKHGLSLRIKGLEPGINDKAEDRSVVFHAANYVSSEFAAEHGRLGRSWGCFALNPESAARIINEIKEGSIVFAYAPQEEKDPYIT